MQHTADTPRGLVGTQRLNASPGERATHAALPAAAAVEKGIKGLGPQGTEIIAGMYNGVYCMGESLGPLVGAPTRPRSSSDSPMLQRLRAVAEPCCVTLSHRRLGLSWPRRLRACCPMGSQAPPSPACRHSP